MDEDEVVEFDTEDEELDEIPQAGDDLDPDDETLPEDDESDVLPYDPDTEGVPDEDPEATE